MRLPPTIEIWVLGMQDVNFEIIYEPGKDDADPLDLLSRHPLPEIAKDAVEGVIKYVLEAEQEKAEKLAKIPNFKHCPSGSLLRTGNITRRIETLHCSTVCRMTCM